MINDDDSTLDGKPVDTPQPDDLTRGDNYLGGDYARDPAASGFGGDYARDPNAAGSAVDENAYARDPHIDTQRVDAPVAQERAALSRRESFRGRGPKGYQRSDDRIRDDVSDAFTDDHDLDATHIEVAVASGAVTLTGAVANSQQKRRASDLAERCTGVQNVRNDIEIVDNGNNEDLFWIPG
jgi:hypothetical protein